MSELLPCPFCGGEDLEIDHIPTYDVHHPDVYEVHCVECGGRGGDGWTEAEAITAWNTRADYHGYELAAIEAWQNIKAYKERTCHNTQSDFDFMCSECGACFDNGRILRFNYCPKCGRKVVDE